jgi:hypothetical protein
MVIIHFFPRRAKYLPHSKAYRFTLTIICANDEIDKIQSKQLAADHLACSDQFEHYWLPADHGLNNMYPSCFLHTVASAGFGNWCDLQSRARPSDCIYNESVRASFHQITTESPSWHRIRSVKRLYGFVKFNILTLIDLPPADLMFHILYMYPVVKFSQVWRQESRNLVHFTIHFEVCRIQIKCFCETFFFSLLQELCLMYF